MSHSALFPISPSKARFTTARTVAALGQIGAHHDEIVFVIADRLQLYNRACRVTEGLPLERVFLDFDLPQPLAKQRQTWLERVKVRMSKDHDVSGWKTLAVEEITDEIFYDIYRRVLISCCVLPEFEADISFAARQHWENKTISSNPGIALSLSRAYILEEITLSIRLHVVDRILCEYYVGSHLTPILKLYAGKYGIDVFALAGVPKWDAQFKFYEYHYDVRSTDRTYGEWILR